MQQTMAHLAQLALRAVVSLLDVLFFPLSYWLLRRPNTSHAVKAVRLDPTDPDSPLTRLPPKDCRPLTRGHAIETCRTVADLFARTCATFADKPCFGFRPVLREEDERQSDGRVLKKLTRDQYTWLSFNEVNERVQSVAKEIQHRFDGQRVVILSDTRLEWVLSCQAVFRCGKTVVTLYPTLSADQLTHALNETESRVVITSSELLPKVHLLLDRAPQVSHVVYFEGPTQPMIAKIFSPKQRSRVSFTSWTDLLASGQSRTDTVVNTSGPDSPAVLMYTSGSTGAPKAVIISHKNLLSAVKAFFTISHVLSSQDVYCAYLPLAHVFEMSAELFFFSIGLSIGFSTPNSLTDSSTSVKKGQRGDCPLLRPTVMCAVPLVLDRIRKSVESQVSQKSSFRRFLFRFLLHYKSQWTQRGFKTPIADRLLCTPIRAILGGRIRLLAAGSAPLSPETHDFVRTCLNVRLIQGYGLTETSASATLMDLDDVTTGRVGPPLEGVLLRLVDWVEGNYRVSERRGEIVVGGDSVTLGYFKQEALTREAYRDENGVRWFFTGDIGQLDPDGSLRVIDRKKDLVKLAMGEYIALGQIEALLKTSDLIDNICIHARSDSSELVAIVVPNYAKLRHLSGLDSSLDTICRLPHVQRLVLDYVREESARLGLSKWETPSKVLLIADEWLPDSGLVTAAMKLRRKQIEAKYVREIGGLHFSSIGS